MQSDFCVCSSCCSIFSFQFLVDHSLSFLFLCCLFFDLRLLITFLTSLKFFSETKHHWCKKGRIRMGLWVDVLLATRKMRVGGKGLILYILQLSDSPYKLFLSKLAHQQEVRHYPRYDPKGECFLWFLTNRRSLEMDVPLKQSRMRNCFWIRDAAICFREVLPPNGKHPLAPNRKLLIWFVKGN